MTAPTTAERLRALLRVAAIEPASEEGVRLRTALQAAAEQIAAVLAPNDSDLCRDCRSLLVGNSDNCMEPHDDDCTVGALERALAAQLETK